MIVAELLGDQACPARTTLNLAATTQVRVYVDVYQIVLGCTVRGEHDLHVHAHRTTPGVSVPVASWYS